MDIRVITKDPKQNNLISSKLLSLTHFFHYVLIFIGNRLLKVNKNKNRLEKTRICEKETDLKLTLLQSQAVKLQ